MKYLKSRISLSFLFCSFSYSYIDQADAVKEHRPVIPKKMAEPKKMVRYRDNKIVSLRGERYTESRDDDSEPRKPKKALP